MQLIYNSGYTVYGIVRRSDGYVYNHVTAVWEIWDGSNLTAEEYDYTLTDKSGDQYIWTFPTLAEAVYTVIYYIKAGAVPATNDLFIISKEVSYSGTAIVDPEDAPSGAYISNETGDNLALNRLNTGAWDDASTSNKTIANKQATEIIDTLNFIGDKAISTQDLEFPRASDTTIPIGIQRACFEIALALLDDADPEMDFASSSMVSHGIANVRSTYDRGTRLPHIMAGVPSSTAWRLLLPYLRDGQRVKLSRVD